LSDFTRYSNSPVAKLPVSLAAVYSDWSASPVYALKIAAVQQLNPS
jgi:hypothetical protein